MAASSYAVDTRLSALPLSKKSALPRAKQHIAAFAICFLLGIVFTFPGSLHPRSALLGFVGDNYQHAWFLWHFARSIVHFQNPFRTRLIFYPHDVNLAWSTTDPLAGIIALPLSLLAGPVFAYNASVILQLSLAAFCGRLLCLRVCGHEIAALIGGICFGFSPFMTAQALGHLSLITTFPIPLFLLALTTILDKGQNHDQEKGQPSAQDGFLLGLALFLTALAHFNYTVFCLVLALVVVAVDLTVRGRDLLAKIGKPLLGAAFTFLIAFSPLLVMLVGNRADIPRTRSAGHFGIFSADLLGFLLPSWDHIVFGHFVASLNPNLFLAGYEGTVYVGIFILILACVGYWKGRGAHRLWSVRAAVVAIVFYLLSLGPRLRLLGRELLVPGPAVLFYKLGFAKFVSAPARFSVITALALAILASLGIAALLESIPSNIAKYATTLAISALLALDLLTIPFPQASIVDPAWSSLLSPREQACTLPHELQQGTVLPFPMIIAPYTLKSMWLQVLDNGRFALVDGYVSYASDRLWADFYTVPIVRSLLTLQGRWNFLADPLADRKYLVPSVQYLNLSAAVVYDSPQKQDAVSYLEKLTQEKGIQSGSCTIFDLRSFVLPAVQEKWGRQEKSLDVHPRFGYIPSQQLDPVGRLK